MEGKDAWESLSEQNTRIVILTIGASGTGKSALINGLVGAEVAKEGGETLFSQTRQITLYKANKKDTDIDVWDTPGMEVVNESVGIEQLVTDIQDKVREVDLVLFCTNMTSARFRQGDHQNVRIMTKAFGESIWKNAVFVLTFANQVKPPPTRKGTPPREYFDERLLEWKGQIQSALKKNGVPEELAESVKVVPAGYYDECSLPGRHNWLSDFWHTCLEATSDGAQAALLHVNMERLKTESEIIASQNSKPRPLKDQKIISHLSTNAAVYGVAGGILGGLALGGVVGGSLATVGVGIAAGATCGIYYGYTKYKAKEQK